MRYYDIIVDHTTYAIADLARVGQHGGRAILCDYREDASTCGGVPLMCNCQQGSPPDA